MDLGLGSAELVRLADARRVAAEAECSAQKRDIWHTGSPAKNWRLAMGKYVLPKVGGVRVDGVGSAAVKEALRLIELTGKHATARTGGAITTVLEWARIEEFRTEGSPVEAVRRNLPKRTAGPNHHEALHWSEVSAALAKIDATNCALSTKRALRFTALTASGQAEVRRTTWEQFVLEGAVRVKPAESTKTGRTHRVSLSRQGLGFCARFVTASARVDRCSRDRVRGQCWGQGDDAGAAQCGSRGVGPRVPVGFKDWARQHDVDDVLSELALEHVDGSSSVAAYAGDDLLERGAAMAGRVSGYAMAVLRPGAVSRLVRRNDRLKSGL